MASPMLVTGGTGTLGRLLVPLLRDAGCDVRVLSRHAHEATAGIEFVTGDLAKDQGIDAAVKGTEIIVHCGGSAKGDQDKTRNLVRAASKAQISHLVYISVVGADRIPVVSGVDRALFGYFGAKLAAEHVVANSGLPWTTLRATQFHDAFLIVGKQMAKMPFVPVFAGVRFQPIDAGEVAARLVELALGRPGGPGTRNGRTPRLPDGRPAPWIPQGARQAPPDHADAAPRQSSPRGRAGANLSPNRAVGRVTWEAFLTERVGPAAISKSSENGAR